MPSRIQPGRSSVASAAPVASRTRRSAPEQRGRERPSDSPTSCNGVGLLAAFRAAVAELEAHVDEVDALNVYPVPDGDTGSNMLATVRSALDEAERVGQGTPGRIAAAISFGALIGARGNSGVITSQIFHGMAESLGEKRRFNGRDLAEALTVGASTAYRAVGSPMEGTILTVIREAAEAAVIAADRSNDISSVLAATVDTANAALARTPSLLPVLREAGVVDAGGAGLVRLFEGARSHSMGRAPAAATGAPPVPRATITPDAEDGFGYETMFLLEPLDGARLDVDAIRASLQAMGESVLVAGDASAVKVHVHSQRPDDIVAFGLAHGALTRLSVENLDLEVQDARERRAAEFTASTKESGVARHEPAVVEPTVEPTAVAETPAERGIAVGLAVISVVAGDGLAAVFRSLGASGIVSGGQGANPSTGELLAAVESSNADEVLLLPNNPNVLLAARQVAGLSNRSVAVVPTRNAAEGLAAMLALDPSGGAAENAPAMLAAARAIQSLRVIDAVRDAHVDGRNVSRGQTIVLDPEEGLVAADDDPIRAVLAGVAALKPGFELVTVYVGAGSDLASAEDLGRRLREHRPNVDVEIVAGGQPFDRYLIAAE